jgi:hypothetical protein
MELKQNNERCSLIHIKYTSAQQILAIRVQIVKLGSSGVRVVYTVMLYLFDQHSIYSLIYYSFH